MEREQGEFSDCRVCIDQIFAVKLLAEKYIGKKTLLTEKAYDNADRKALW